MTRKTWETKRQGRLLFCGDSRLTSPHFVLYYDWINWRIVGGLRDGRQGGER